MTEEEILEHLKNDLYSYQEFIDEMIIFFLKENPHEKEYWGKWFNNEKL
jgi:hypothetical protein